MKSSTSSQMESVSVSSGSTAYAECIEGVSVAVACAVWDRCTSALVDVSRSAADAACRRFRQSSTSSQMESVSASSAQVPPQTSRASRVFPSQSHAPGFAVHPHVDVSGSVADAACVEGPDAVVDVIADGVGVGRRHSGR